MKNIEDFFLDFLESDSEFEIEFENFKANIENHIENEKSDLKEILHMIAKISNNHNRSHDLIFKTEKVLELFESDMKESFSNIELFNIFDNNKRILLFLFEKEILIPDRNLFTLITKEKQYKKRGYIEFFMKEFEPFMDEDLKQTIISNTPELAEIDSETFEYRRKNGENHHYICELIRKDLVEEFIVHINKNHYSLSSKIN